MRRLLRKLRTEWPDEVTAILRGLERQYALGRISREEHEALIEGVHEGETFAHMVAEPFDMEDERHECVVCGSNAMLLTMGGSGRPCPACGTNVTTRTLKERGIL